MVAVMTTRAKRLRLVSHSDSGACDRGLSDATPMSKTPETSVNVALVNGNVRECHDDSAWVDKIRLDETRRVLMSQHATSCIL